jgi:protein TonB
MKREYRAFNLSLLIHGILLVLFFGATTFHPLARPPILITFDLIKSNEEPPGGGAPTPSAAPASEILRTAPKKPSNPEQPAPRADPSPPETAPGQPEVAAPPSITLQQDAAGAAPILTAGRGQTEATISPGAQQIASGQTGGMPGGREHEEGAALQGRIRYLREHFEYIRDRVMRNIEYPERARRMNWEGTVLMSFVVTTDGRADNITIFQSSGFPVLDRSAVEAIRRSVPFPKPPVAAQIVIPILYSLR